METETKKMSTLMLLVHRLTVFATVVLIPILLMVRMASKTSTTTMTTISAHVLLVYGPAVFATVVLIPILLMVRMSLIITTATTTQVHGWTFVPVVRKEIDAWNYWIIQIRRSATDETKTRMNGTLTVTLSFFIISYIQRLKHDDNICTVTNNYIMSKVKWSN